jgi:hypothetical protein
MPPVRLLSHERFGARAEVVGRKGQDAGVLGGASAACARGNR